MKNKIKGKKDNKGLMRAENLNEEEKVPNERP